MVTFNANHWSHKITSKLDLQLKTVIKRDTNGGRRDIRGKIKKWRHSKKMNGLIIYTEKIQYLQSSSQYLIQRENHGYFSYNICKALNMLWIYRHSRVFKNTYHCGLKIVIRNAVYYAWYLQVVSAAILLLLRLIFFKINYLFFQFTIKIFYHCYITLEFFILRHNLVQTFCKSFNFFTEFMQISINDNAYFNI